MGKKKPIECSKELSGCGAICVEVGKAIGYPKRSQETRSIAEGTPNERRIGGHEYRYVCPDCGKEWLQDTFNRVIFPIESSQFQIKIKNGKEIYSTKNKYLFEFNGLEPGKQYTSEEVKNIRRKKDR